MWTKMLENHLFCNLNFCCLCLKNSQHFHYQCLQQYKNNAKANFIIHNCLIDFQLSSSTIYYAKDRIITEYRLTTIINLNQWLGWYVLHSFCSVRKHITRYSFIVGQIFFCPNIINYSLVWLGWPILGCQDEKCAWLNIYLLF